MFKKLLIAILMLFVLTPSAHAVTEGTMCNFLVDELNDHWSGTGAFTAETLYMALYTSTPSDAGGGTEVSTTDTGYTRIAAGAFDVSASEATANTADIGFPTPTGSTNWGTINSWALVNASSGAADCYFWGAVDTNRTINQGDPAPSFLAGSLNISGD